MTFTDVVARVLVKATFYSILLLFSVAVEGSANAWLLILFLLAPSINGIPRKVES